VTQPCARDHTESQSPLEFIYSSLLPVQIVSNKYNQARGPQLYATRSDALMDESAGEAAIRDAISEQERETRKDSADDLIPPDQA
jgi:hypothetical protein